MKVSYIVSTYNDKNLKDSMNSIIEQQYNDIEIILVDDAGSKNGRYIESLKTKIIVIKNETNIGLTKSLNKALKLATGDIIIRHDADDISYPYRTQKIINYFKKNDNIDIISSFAYINNGRNKTLVTAPIEDEEITATLLGKNCLIHPTLAFRKNILDDLAGYNEYFKYAQDYEFYLRAMVFNFKFKTIAEPLIEKTYSKDNISVKHRKQQLFYELAAKSLYFAQQPFQYLYLKSIISTLLKLIIPMGIRNFRNKL